MKRTHFLACLATLCCACGLQASPITVEEPADYITEQQIQEQWEKIPDVAQYKGADWDNFVFAASGIDPYRAMQLAETDPEISYFFFVKAYQLVLEHGDDARVFQHGDAVFFTGEPWWGSAPDLADGYIKTPVE